MPEEEDAIAPTDEESPDTEEGGDEDSDEDEDAEGEEGEDAESAESSERPVAEPPPRPRQVPPPQYPPSPITQQERHGTTVPNAESLEIVFLSGVLRGRRLDLKPDKSFLGVGVTEVSHSQDVNWNENKTGKYRPGSTFKGLGSRTYNFNVTFFDRKHDVAHLAEHLSYLHALTDGEDTPPQLFVRQGDMMLSPSVCQSISWKYSDPLPGSKGFHKAECDLKFNLLAGNQSIHAMGPPLTSTPYGDEVLLETAAERREAADREIASLILGDCLGPEGKASLEGLLEDDGAKLQNPEDIANLDRYTRSQLIISGIIPPNVIKDESVNSLIAEDLAFILAENEPGVSYQARGLAQALIDDDPSSLDPSIEINYDELKHDYDLIRKSMESGNIVNSPLFGGGEGTALERLTRFGHCGLSMREAGGLNIGAAPSNNEEKEAIDLLNDFLGYASDEEIMKAFGLDTQSQVRQVKNGIPYHSRSEFIRHNAREGQGINGHSAWGAFKTYAEEEELKIREEESTEGNEEPQSP